MGAGRGLPRWARIVLRGANELLIQRDFVPGQEISLPIQEGTQHTKPLISPLPDLIDVRPPGELFI